ncbi:MAG: hypothetical protein OXO53_11505 [Chloroflexota bacterium]|nr:hypothetical protein [Chloroflexota bacterium]
MTLFLQNVEWLKDHEVGEVGAIVLFGVYLVMSGIGVSLGFLSVKVKNRIAAIASAIGRAIFVFLPLLMFIILSADWALGLYFHLFAVLWLPVSAALFVGLAAIREH